MTIIAVASLVALTEAWMAIESLSLGLWVIASATAAFAAALVPAYLVNQKGKTERAVLVTCVAILGIQSVYLLVYPRAYAALVFASVVIVALALSFVRGKALLRIMAAAWGVGAAAVVYGILGQSLFDVPAVADAPILLGTGLAALTVIMVLLWQFARHFTRALEEVQGANVELISARKKLEELDEMKSRFINTAAHELRTPLMPLRTQVHVMLHNPASEPTDAQRAALGVMKRNLDRLGTLVEDLLTVARSQVGRLGIEAQPVELGKVLVEAGESFEAVGKDRGVDLTLQTTEVSVVADAKRVSQVVSNLLSNAFKFTPRGGKIRIDVQDSGERVRVAVVDNGRGIERADLVKLFEPFAQVHDTAQVSDPGSGLGLYISKQFIQLQGGEIGVESAGRNKGSTFWFTLPKAGH